MVLTLQIFIDIQGMHLIVILYKSRVVYTSTACKYIDSFFFPSAQ